MNQTVGFRGAQDQGFGIQADDFIAVEAGGRLFPVGVKLAALRQLSRCGVAGFKMLLGIFLQLMGLQRPAALCADIVGEALLGKADDQCPLGLVAVILGVTGIKSHG